MKYTIIWILAMVAFGEQFRYVENIINLTPPTIQDEADVITSPELITTLNANNTKASLGLDVDNNSLNTIITLLNEDAEDLDQFQAKTQQGTVMGYEWQESSDIISYFDIPYGKFGSLFEAPSKPDSWEDIRRVEEHSKRCPQMEDDTFVGNLDCLTLSVFRPLVSENTSVLFYIHESDFKTGSGNPAIYGPDYIVPKNITLVLPNYRLGPLGFLCLQNETAPGNAALKDLTLALQWTKNNIKAFGGDPSKIIVGGDGAAGALAGYLAISPRSKEYISKVITDSGSLLSHWAIDRYPVETSTRLAEEIEDILQTKKSLDELFRSIDVEDLIKYTKKADLKPCIEESVENSFITSSPWKIIHNENITVPFIIGTANHAGLLEALQYIDEERLTELNGNFSVSLPNDLTFKNSGQMIDVSESLKRQYFGVGNITANQSEQLSLYYTDASYHMPGLLVARALVNAGAIVYFYEFSFVGKLNNKLLPMEEVPNFGAVRGDIVKYVFTQDASIIHTDADERRIVDLMTDLWISFMQTGIPAANEIEWHKFDITQDTEEQWLSINTVTTSQKGFYINRLKLWTEIYNKHFIESNLASWAEVNRYMTFLALLYVFYAM